MKPPSVMAEMSLFQIDKLAHILVFGILSFLYLWAYWDKKDLKWFRIIVFASICYGLILECLQSLSFTERDFDIFDIIANIIGSIAGAAIFVFLKKR